MQPFDAYILGSESVMQPFDAHKYGSESAMQPFDARLFLRVPCNCLMLIYIRI